MDLYDSWVPCWDSLTGIVTSLEKPGSSRRMIRANAGLNASQGESSEQQRFMGFFKCVGKLLRNSVAAFGKNSKKQAEKKKTLGSFLALPIYQKNMGPRVMVVRHCKLSAPNWLESEVDRVRTFPAIIENLKPHCEKSCHVWRCFAWHVWIVQCKNSGLGIVVQMQWNGHIVLAKYKEEQTFSFSFRSMITMNRLFMEKKGFHYQHWWTDTL